MLILKAFSPMHELTGFTPEPDDDCTFKSVYVYVVSYVFGWLCVSCLCCAWYVWAVYVWCGVCVVCEWVCSTDHLSGIQFFKLPPHIWHLLTQTWATSPSVPSPVPFGLSVISSFNSVPVAFAVLKVFSLWRSCGSIYWRHVFLVICKGLDGWVAPRWLRRALF